jgi:hypothetical protein
MRILRKSSGAPQILGALWVLVWSISSAAGTAPAEQSFERVFARFNVSAPPPYRAFRRMEAGIEGSSNQGWLEVSTEYSAAQGFRFTVAREGGSEYVRNKVLRKLLLNEKDLLARGQPLRAALAPRNYQFQDGGLTDNGLRRLMLTPIRKGEGIVTGEALVDANDAIVRMEGRLVKSPSFWVRDVDVTWQFARAGEHIVPVQMDTSGRVRFYGKSYFRMYYDYEFIEGVPGETRLKAAAFR